MPGSTRVEPAWCARSFDLGYYRELIDKAWGEISFAYTSGNQNIHLDAVQIL